MIFDMYKKSDLRLSGLRSKPPLDKKLSSRSARERVQKADLVARGISADILSVDIISEEIVQREKEGLRNLDGTVMTVENYLQAVETLKKDGNLPIANFGFKNSKWMALKDNEDTRRVSRKKNYMLDIENAKRLIPKYAREEREKFR